MFYVSSILPHYQEERFLVGNIKNRWIIAEDGPINRPLQGFHGMRPMQGTLPEAVTDATDGLDQVGIGGVFLYFFAEPAYMDIDGTRITNVIVAPDIVQ